MRRERVGPNPLDHARAPGGGHFGVSATVREERIQETEPAASDAISEVENDAIAGPERIADESSELLFDWSAQAGPEVDVPDAVRANLELPCARAHRLKQRPDRRLADRSDMEQEITK